MHKGSVPGDHRHCSRVDTSHLVRTWVEGEAINDRVGLSSNYTLTRWQSQWDDANLSGRLLSCLINKGILRTRASAEKFRLKTTKQHTVDSRTYSPAGILQMANLYHPPLCLSVLPGSSFGLYRALSEIRANALPLCAHFPLSVIS